MCMLNRVYTLHTYWNRIKEGTARNYYRYLYSKSSIHSNSVRVRSQRKLTSYDKNMHAYVVSISHDSMLKFVLLLYNSHIFF
jgi:CDP-diacylglycerol pyrophosphatase